MEFVIIGGDAAGMSAAARARRNAPDLNITVLEKSGDVSYSACGMPYNLADPTREMDDLVVRPANVFVEEQNINLLTGHTVLSIDTDLQEVSGVDSKSEKFSIPYDNLLIATGGSPLVPNLEGFDLPGVMALKSLEDGRRIKKYIREKDVKKAAIIGIGYIGLEMCEGLDALGVDIEMLERSSEFLPWMPDELSSVIRSEVESRGVKIHTGEEVMEIRRGADGLEVITRNVSVKTDLVVVAIGIKPNSELAARAGLALGTAGAIAVDKNIRTSVGNIYAAGDCADTYNVITGEKTWIPLALRANRAGRAVGDIVTGIDVALEGVVGTSVFKIFDLEVARTGLTEKEAVQAGFSPESVFIKARSRAHRHPGGSAIYTHMIGDRVTGRLLGVQMVGREGVAHRVNTPAVALHAGMTVADFSACDLAYAPPFGPLWDPLLIAASQLLKKTGGNG